MDFGSGARIIVTGGAGFLGSTVVDLLLARKCRVVVIDDLSNGLLRNLPTDHPSLTVRIAKIGDINFAAPLIEEVGAADAVFHLASPIGVLRAHSERFAVAKGILDSGSAIAEACLRTRRPLLFASSSEVYGAGQEEAIDETVPVVTDIRPRWGYAAAKAAVEHLVAALFQDFGVPTWIVRPFNLAGPRQRSTTGQVIPVFVEAALRGEPITLHDGGGQRRSFLHVADAADGLIGIMQSTELQGRPVNIGNAQSIRISELAHLVVEAVGNPVPIVPRPSKAIFGEDFAATGDRVPDISLLRMTTGWQPSRTIREAIAGCAMHMGRERALA